MPNPTNENAPAAQKTSEKAKKRNNYNEYDYKNLPGEVVNSGAAFRPSLTLDEALNKLDLVHRPVLSGWTVAEDRRKATKKPFNSNPWTGRGSTTKGTEWKIEPQVWRLISHNGYYFLAKHKGANNGFEFWHIKDWPSGAPTVASITDPSTPVTMPSGPALTTRVRGTSIGSSSVTGTTTVVMHMPAAASTTTTPDDWESL